MKKTYIATEKDIEHNWHIVDAKDKILGRLASKVASILKGKDKPYYTPNMDTGDSVIVINASKVRVTGKKLKDKTYLHYSGYPGGLKKYSLESMLKKNSSRVIYLAVKRMLPSGPLGYRVIKKLKVYDNEAHPHKAQNPAVLEV